MTAERDAAVAALARVEAAFDPGELECVQVGLACPSVNPPDRWCRACRITDALVGAEGDAGGEVAPAGPDDARGRQIGAQRLAEAAGRAKDAGERRLGR